MEAIETKKKGIFSSAFNSTFILSCLICLLFYMIVMLAYPIRFDTNDDSSIMYQLAGYSTGSPQPYATFSPITLGLMVSTLYKLLPSIPWYTVFMLTIMYASTVAMVYVILSESMRNEVAPVLRIVIIGVFLFLIALQSIVYLQFTTAAGFAGGASIVLCYFFNPRKKLNSVVYIIAIALFFFLSISYRFQPGNLLMLFHSCIILYKLVYNTKNYKAYIATISVIFLVFFASRQIHIMYRNVEEWQDYGAFNSQRAQFMDYPNVSYAQNPEVYEAVGWSQVEVSLANSSCFIFPQFNLEALTHINNASAEAYGIGWQKSELGTDAALALLKRVTTSKFNRITYISLTGIWAASIAIAVLNKWKKDRSEYRFALKAFVRARFFQNNKLILTIGIILLFHAAFAYLLVGLRFPDYVFRMMALIFAPISISNLVSMVGCDRMPFFYEGIAELKETIGESNNKVATKYTKTGSYIPERTSKCIAIICAILLVINLGLTDYLFSLFDRQSMRAEKIQLESLRKQFENYVMAHPENFYVRSVSAGGIANPFTVYADQKPINYSAFGGASYLSPIALEKYRFLGRDHLLLDDFWDENVYFITVGTGSLLLEYFQQMDPDCFFRTVDQLPSGQYVYKLEKPTSASSGE